MAPVVLVHGFASSFEREWVQPGWTTLLEEAGRTVIGVDLLGHGAAEKPHDPAAYAAVEDAVAAVLPGEAVDGIGFSMGARVLLTLASRTPASFGRIVVGGVGGRLLDTGFDDGQGRAIVDGVEGRESDDPLAQAFGRFARSPGNDPEALAAFLRRPHVPLTAQALSAITNPVMIVAGDRDPLAGDPEALAAVMPNAQFKVLRNVDHLATAHDFGFIDAALNFLDAT